MGIMRFLAGTRRSRPPSQLRSVRPAVVVLAALSLLALGATAAQGASSTIYVDHGNPNCDDAGSGSQSQPYCHIQNAVNQLVISAQTVIVSSGTYTEKVSITSKRGSTDSPLVVRAADGASVTVRDQANGFYISSSSYLTIQGFTVTNTNGVGIYATGSDHVTIAGNHVSYAGQGVNGSKDQGIRLSGTNDSLVQGNTTDHNSEAGIQLVSGSTGNTIQGNESFANADGLSRSVPGIDLRSPGNTVVGNLSHDNEDSGIQSYTGGSNGLIAGNVTYYNGDHGIDNLSVTGQRIIGNSVWWNFTAGINVEGTSTGAIIENNVSVDNGYGIDPCVTGPCSPRTRGQIRVDQNSTPATVDYNIVWSSRLDLSKVLYVWNTSSYTSRSAFQAASGQGGNDKDADPQWVNASGHDYHLTAGSPAIDSANAGVSGEPQTDFDGHGRVDDPATPNTGTPAGSYYDRGAYEFQGGGPPPDNPPAAALSVTPPSGTAPLAVTADASASTDNDATAISSYAFDFGDGATVGPQDGPTANHTYTASGAYTVTVTVTDTASLSSQTTKQVDVSSGGGSTNLVGNPGFETDLSGWSASGSGTGVTLTRVSGGHSGGFTAKLTNPGSASTNCTLNDSPNWVMTTSAGAYTGSIWVRADAAGGTFKLRFREYNGSVLVGSATTTATLSTSWQQVTVGYTPGAPGTSTLDLNAYVSSSPPGTCFYADDASITRA